MDEDQTCVILCQNTLTKKDINTLIKYVKSQYRVHWSLDGLPGAHLYRTTSGEEKLETAWPMGRYKKKENPDRVLLNNHVELTVKYALDPKKEGGKSYRIVYFQVTPESIEYHQMSPEQAHDHCRRRTTLVTTPMDIGTLGQSTSYPVTWSYSVRWLADPKTSWADRWNVYVNASRGEGQIHWFGIINSLMIVFFLSVMVAMIMLRTLHADFQKYNNSTDPDETETGWKLIHGDVFRAPPRTMLFSSLVGSGTQVLAMCVVTMVFAVLGFLSPANRGLLVTAMLILFIWMGVLGGYISGRIYGMFGGQSWRKNAFHTATTVPGVIFGVLFFLNLFLWGKHSSASIPFLYLLALVALWFGISVPLTMLGAHFANRKPPITHPVQVMHIPRTVPTQVWYMNPMFSIFLGGVLPFGAIFIELFFVFSSVWLQQIHYLFSFLFLILVILIITCSEIAVVMVYFQLCAENHAWWWRAFLTPAASAAYVLLYSLFYFITTLKITSFVAAVLYFGYSFCMAVGVFVITGAIGYHASFWFVRKIYSSVKFA